MRPAKIWERGNGYPAVGAYVRGAGQLWRIESIGTRVFVSDSTAGGDYVYGQVSEADWGDCEEGDEFAAEVELDA